MDHEDYAVIDYELVTYYYNIGAFHDSRGVDGKGFSKTSDPNF